MHKSPRPGQAKELANPSAVQVSVALPHSAKVLAVAVTWFCVITLSVFPVSAAGPATQEQQPEVAAQAQPGDQPPSPNLEPVDLSDEVVRDVLTRLQRSIETHDLDHLMEIFDQQNMKDYAQFRDQMVSFFRRYDSVRFRYQLLQVTTDKDGGFAVADIDMDADPSDILPTPQRRSTQMRFQMKRGPKGWKVIALRPADFFNQ